jgi:hypothetical protein
MMLGRLQSEFCDYILDRSDAIAAEAVGDMDVYHYAYRAQLLNTLRDTFEKSWSWLGDDAFEAAATAHIAAHPPSSWTLNVYGEGFDRTLAALHPDDPEIAELAWLEWHLRRAFDGPDSDQADPATFATIDWDSAVLFAVPTLRVGAITTNCAAIWTALSEDETPPPAEKLPVPGAIRVWRQGLSAKFRSIDTIEAEALKLMQEGVGFAEICARLGADEIGRVFGVWLQDGLIAAIEDNSPMSR